MRAMMEAIGLDPDSVEAGDMPVIAEELRERCSCCNSTDVCEEWLQGEQAGDNNFCPNAPIFELLARYGGHERK